MTAPAVPAPVGPLLVIAGPTASGKTALSIQAALRLEAEIVSADSMQLYRGLDIGTAKATSEEQSLVRHHMLDVLDPRETCSVSRYADMAGGVCRSLLVKGRLPLVTGGTGLYLEGLIAGTEYAGTEEDHALRHELEERWDREGGARLFEELRLIDPERAEKLSPSDRRRIIRALEIYRLTGETISEHDRKSRLRPPAFSAFRCVLDYHDRAKLYERIELRARRMFSRGLLEETEKLLRLNLPPESTCLQAIGYREAALLLRGECSQEEAVALLTQATRRYAKRQMTWFRRWDDALRLYMDETEQEEALERLLSAFEAFRSRIPEGEKT